MNRLTIPRLALALGAAALLFAGCTIRLHGSASATTSAKAKSSHPEVKAKKVDGPKVDLKSLEGDMGLEDLGDVKLNTPAKPVEEPEKKPAAEEKRKKDEKEAEKKDKVKVLRRNWW